MRNRKEADANRWIEEIDSHKPLAEVLKASGDSERSREEAETVIALCRRLSDRTGLPDHRILLADNLSELAKWSGERNQFQEIDARFREADEILKELSDSAADKSPVLKNRSAILEKWTAWLLGSNQLQQAETVCRKLLAVDQALLQSSPDVYLYQTYLVGALRSLAKAILGQGRIKEAVEMSNRHAAESEKVAHDFSGNPASQLMLATECLNLGNFYSELAEEAHDNERKEFAAREAEYFRRCIDIIEAFIRERDDEPEFSRYQVTCDDLRAAAAVETHFRYAPAGFNSRGDRHLTTT